MFVRKSTFEDLQAKVESLERQSKTQAKFLHKDYEALKSQKKEIEQIEKEVGIEQRSFYDIGSPFGLYSFFGTSRVQEAKPFSVKGKVNAILDHLNLVEDVTATTKLITKPVEKKKKGKK